MYGRQFDAIPRLKGAFLWSQFAAAKRAGGQMVYIAMFDEVDEGTAIFKCSNDIPVGESVKFLTYEGLPSDFYLRLAGEGARLIRGQRTDEFPNLSAHYDRMMARPAIQKTIEIESAIGYALPR